MPSDSSRETTESGQGRSTLAPEAVSKSNIPAPPSRTERVQSWLLSNALLIQVLLAAMSVAAGIIALPIVIFGSLMALGGNVSVLSVGMLTVAVGFAIITVLAAWVIIYAYAETRNQGLPFVDTHGILPVVSDGVWSLKVATAGIFFLCLFAYVLSSLTVEFRPRLMLQLLGISCLLLTVAVFLHATAEFVMSMIYPGN